MERVHGDQPALLRVLGPIELQIHRSPVRLSDLERGLLALAAFRTMIGGDELVHWLWGEDPPASARNRIQALVSAIRQKAGDAPVLVTDGRGYRLSPGVCVDHALWQASVTRARHLRAVDPASAIASYDEAVELFIDPPLQGAPRTQGADLERDRLDQERLQVVEERLACRLDSGHHDGLVSEVATLSGQHPYHEGFLALYILALAATGQQRQALELYRASRGRLGDELGIEPSARLRAAHERVLRGDVPRVAAAEVADGATAADTGIHLAVLQAPAVLPVPQTLPRPPAGFVGRGVELSRLVRAAEQARERPVVVSLTGLTGIGKSALAVEAGARLRDQFPDGSLYADLSATFADDGVHTEVGNFLHLLGVLPEAIPEDPRARSGLYRSLIGARRVLVVIDNVDSRDGRVDPNLQDLLPTAPGSMAMITSRSPIDRLDPTLRICVTALPEDEAIRLLENSAGVERISAEPDAVRELVRHTGALPLALRLVGGRLAQRPDLTARELARRLADTARGLGVLEESGTEESSLRASLTLAWNRLPEQTRLTVGLLTQLPVDVFSAWVPQALLGDDTAGEHAMNSLVDAGFVEPVILPNRRAQYRLHDLVARFARERFEPPDDEPPASVTAVATALLERLARYHATFPLQFLPLPPLGDPPRNTGDDLDTDEAHELLLTELATARGCARFLAPHAPALAWRLLAACENAHHVSAEKESWSAAVDTVVAGLDPVRDDDRLGAAILSVCRAWHLQDGLGQYTAALSMAVNARRELTLLGAIPHAMAAGLVAANSAVALSDRATADAELRLTADAALRPDTRVLTGWRHIVQGELHNDYDELSQSEAELARARDVLHETGERIGYAFATAYLSRACRRQGKLGPARILADEALEEFAHYRAEQAYTVALDARAEVGVELGHGDEALEQATNALSRAVAAQDAFMTARATRTRARALRVLGRLHEAADELTRSIDMFAAIDRTLSVAATLHDLAIVQDLMAEPGAASESLRQERKALEHARLERSDALRGQIR